MDSLRNTFLNSKKVGQTIVYAIVPLWFSRISSQIGIKFKKKKSKF